MLLMVEIALTRCPHIDMGQWAREKGEKRQAVVWLHIHHTVVSREIAEPTRFQHPVNLIEHLPGVWYVLVHMRANYDIHTGRGLLQVHCVALGEVEVWLVE